MGRFLVIAGQESWAELRGNGRRVLSTLDVPAAGFNNNVPGKPILTYVDLDD